MDIFERAVYLGRYIVENNTTIRQTATMFELKKSTVHRDVARVLPQINSALAYGVHAVLEENKKVRHIRGGEATKQKKLALKKK